MGLSAHIKLAWSWIHTEKMASVHQWIKHDTKSSKVGLYLKGSGLRLPLGSPMLDTYAFIVLIRAFSETPLRDNIKISDMTARMISNEHD